MGRITFLLLMLFACDAVGQQATQYSHFVTNYLMINPAVTGSAPCLDLKMGYRKQWAGFEGAPTTAYGAVHGVAGEKKRNFHGLGGMVETDSQGPIANTSIYGLYAYHMKVSRNAMLSLGVAAGFMQYRVQLADLNFSNNDDPLLDIGGSSYVLPQINFGMWLYKKDRFIGMSFRNLTANRLPNFSGDSQAKSRMHFSMTAGKLIDMSQDFTFRPAVHIKYVGKSKMAMDVQATVDYSNKFQLGLGYRAGRYLTALAKVDVFDYVTVAYAYDLTMNSLRYASPHTHEITIGIQACPKGGYGNRLPCSAYD